MLNLLVKGGPVLWFLILISFVVIAVVIERILFFRRLGGDEEKLFQHLSSSLEKGHFEEALAICDHAVSPLGSLVKAGIEHRGYADSSLKEIMEDAVNQETPRLERNLSILETIAHIGPLLGLLGTVTGTMNAFGILGAFGAVSDPTILAKGISEALITTVAGICVAVPSVIFYNYFQGRVNRILLRLEHQVNEIILLIVSNRKNKTPSEEEA
jgi:biopolymer transport protein ExbB